MSVNSILDKVLSIANGEPARVIGYGGAAIVYLVAKFSGSIEDVTPEAALLQVGSALALIVTFVESIRRLVFSPNTVQAIVDNAAETGDTTVPAPPASDVASAGNG